MTMEKGDLIVTFVFFALFLYFFLLFFSLFLKYLRLNYSSGSLRRKAKNLEGAMKHT